MKLRRSIFQCLLLAVVLATGRALAESVPQPAPPAGPTVGRALDVPDGALVAAGQAPEVDVLFTGDVIGFIEPCG